MAPPALSEAEPLKETFLHNRGNDPLDEGLLLRGRICLDFR